jgi:ribonuclease HII
MGVRAGGLRAGVVPDPARRVRVAGVDEAGRGPLAGPVVAAAVILDPSRPIEGLRDSKLLRPRVRRELAAVIRSRALAWAVAGADCQEIDALNILQATWLAMRRALLGLAVAPTHVQVDGNRLPLFADLGLGCTAEAIVGGDATESAISAASILAKTHRDAIMGQLEGCYPGYGFGRHMGYPTPEHVAALARYAPSPVHRRSFRAGPRAAAEPVESHPVPGA